MNTLLIDIMMEKMTFREQQPAVQVCCGGRKALVLTGEREVTARLVPPGEDTAETEVTEWEYDSRWLDLSGCGGGSAAVLAAAKRAVLADIDAWDGSAAVNGFAVNGVRVWLDKGTRVGLMNSTTIAKNAGEEKTELWFGTAHVEVSCDAALSMLSEIEMYALACYNTTARHKAAVAAMDNVTAVVGYDYKAGYPKCVTFNV